jgi:hypothetical protein
LARYHHAASIDEKSKNLKSRGLNKSISQPGLAEISRRAHSVVTMRKLYEKVVGPEGL